MYKSCSYCGRIHPSNYICSKKPKKYKNKQRTKSTDFRSTYKWQVKREHIKELDLHMCVVCAEDIVANKDYAYDDLEVHHIEPLEEAYDKRLDDDNLATLCKHHHELAEKGEITRKKLKELIKKRLEY